MNSLVAMGAGLRESTGLLATPWIFHLFRAAEVAWIMAGIS